MIDTAYDKEASTTYDSIRFSSPSGKVIHEIELSFLQDTLKFVNKEAKTLEVGCGTGRLFFEVLQSGYFSHGLDASFHMLGECAEKIKNPFPDAGFVLAEAGRIPFKEKSFDLLYSIRVLNQTGSSDYALSVIAEMVRVAKPGGYVLVEFMNYYRKHPWGKRKYWGPKEMVFSEKMNVRLRPREVIAKAEENGAKLIWFRGAFFLGMTGFYLTPVRLLKVISSMDQFLSKMFPYMCSRCYILLQKRG